MGLADAKLPFRCRLVQRKQSFNFTMKMSEINDLSETELDKKFRELGKELLDLQIRKQTGQVEKPHLIKSIRRDRAKILTVLSQSKEESS